MSEYVPPRTITFDPTGVLFAVVGDEPGPGGANHEYSLVKVFTQEIVATIKFQKGGVADNGINGITNESLLALVIDRLECFQAGPFACGSNEMALNACRIAMDALNSRTKDRMARGVEGQEKA